MVVRLLDHVLACRPRLLARLMVAGRSMVIRLRFRSVHSRFGCRSLIEMVRVNFLLTMGL